MAQYRLVLPRKIESNDLAKLKSALDTLRDVLGMWQGRITKVHDDGIERICYSFGRDCTPVIRGPRKPRNADKTKTPKLKVKLN
jgi:hypothetical protein